MFGIPDYFVDKCVEHFGSYGQIDILQEECAELIKACSKVKRAKEGSLENLKEELAHVAISSGVVANILGITEADIREEVDKKAYKYNFYKTMEE